MKSGRDDDGPLFPDDGSSSVFPDRTTTTTTCTRLVLVTGAVHGQHPADSPVSDKTPWRLTLHYVARPRLRKRRILR